MDEFLCDNWVTDFQTNNRRNQVLWHPRNLELKSESLLPWAFPETLNFDNSHFSFAGLGSGRWNAHTLTRKCVDQEIVRATAQETFVGVHRNTTWSRWVVTERPWHLLRVISMIYWCQKKFFFLIGAKNARQQWTQFFFCLCQNKPQLAYTDFRRKLNCLLSQCSTKNTWYFRVISVGMGNFLRRISHNFFAESELYMYLSPISVTIQ